ncbi:class I SAM-dependent methyltransferase [Kitasatospora sp. NBC_00374]|uniref:class I SAM-dependent methyltransferase n=1 Tax=Kitasatospora sp. NBC_00374 TaxID=2975964 RepID=UPI0032523BA9
MVFGEAVEQYEAARPGYPEALVADVLAFAGPGRPVLEVGAGTGKATTSFAAHGLDLTCLEPDARMADRLAGRFAADPRVSVEVVAFEEWTPARRYGLLFSAQAWHWIDPARSWDLAHAALEPGGSLALFWNAFGVADAALFAALAAVNRRYGTDPSHIPHGAPAESLAGDIEVGGDWPAAQLAGDTRFTDHVNRRYRGRHSYTSAGYLDLLTSISEYRMMPDTARAAALAHVARTIDDHGGTIELAAVTDLFLARTV